MAVEAVTDRRTSWRVVRVDSRGQRTAATVCPPVLAASDRLPGDLLEQLEMPL